MKKGEEFFRRNLLINRDFALLFFGRLVSQIGDGIHYLGLTWLVLDITGSGAALGSMIFVSSIPALILLPFTGVLADLCNRKIIVVSMDILRGLIMLFIAFLLKIGNVTLPALYIATILSTLCGVFFGPAISATIPGIVKKEELVKANALNNVSRAATSIVGPVLGAFLLAKAGYIGVFMINGIAFLFSALSEMFIHFPQMEKSDESSTGDTSSVKFFRSLIEGLIYVWKNIGLRTVILFALAVNFMGAPIFSVILPYFTKETLGFGAQQFSVIQASLPVGFLIGTALIGYLSKKYTKVQLLSVGIGMQGLTGVIFGLIAFPSIYINMNATLLLLILSLAIFLIGFLNTLINVPFEVTIQETVPDNYRGRVYGLLDSLMQMLVPVSTAISGILVDQLPIAGIFIMVGIVIIVLGIGLATSANVKSFYKCSNLSLFEEAS